MATLHSLHCPGFEQLPSISYTCKSYNSWSWVDHISCSSSNAVSNLEILYEESGQDHVSIYCELNVKFQVEFTFDEFTQSR